MTDYTATERAERLRKRRIAEGYKTATIWTPGANMEALRRAYPGIRGGIDWSKVFSAALAHAEQHQGEQ